MKFTNEEKTILIAIVVAAAAGLIINLIFSYNKKLNEKPIQAPALLININTASAGDFDRLPGVGKVIADRIVEYRAKNGVFKSIEDLAKVKGITGSKLEKIRKFVNL
jgi:competence ComEA-like helix-hairpin-helix protein